MRLLQIDYFLEMAETLNFTHAASNLFISQPALSKQISMLEEEIGTKLFERTSRKVSLTPAGLQLQADLLKVRRDLEAAVERAKDIGKQNKRTLHIRCFDGRVTQDYLPVLYQKINEKYPEIEIDFAIGKFEENWLDFQRDKMDVLITLSQDYEPAEGMICRKIVQRKEVIVYSKNLINKNGDEVCPKDFIGKNLLIPRPKKGHRLYDAILSVVKDLGIDDPPLVEIDNIQTLYANLELGKGYGILAEEAVAGNMNLQKFPLQDDLNSWVLAVVREENRFARQVIENVF